MVQAAAAVERGGLDAREVVAELIRSSGLARTQLVSRAASVLGVSERTVWRRVREVGERSSGWECADGRRRRRRGPRGPSERLLGEARAAVRGCLAKLGWCAGEGAVRGALGERFSLRVVRRVLRELKAARRQRERARLNARRFRFAAHARGAVWALDASQVAGRGGAARGGGSVQGAGAACARGELGRRSCEHSIHVEVLRDPATRRVWCTGLQASPTAERAAAWLEAEIERVGYAPLVVSTDNGSAYTGEAFRECLERHRVVHLLNLPHTPQHNAHAERAVKELKQVAGIPTGRLPPRTPELESRLRAAVRWLNGWLVRGVLDKRTALQAAREMPVAERLVDREDFYRETCCAIEKAVQGCNGSRAARLAERKAIFAVLERFNLITTTRGGKDAAKLNTDKSR